MSNAGIAPESADSERWRPNRGDGVGLIKALGSHEGATDVPEFGAGIGRAI
ncbi:hypothetical protein D3C78_1268810 [compost metagenome]